MDSAEEVKEEEVSPTVRLVQHSNTPESVAENIKALVVDSRLHKSKRLYVNHKQNLKILAQLERKLTENYGVEKK